MSRTGVWIIRVALTVQFLGVLAIPALLAPRHTIALFESAVHALTINRR